jgi:hypothetical protein
VGTARLTRGGRFHVAVSGAGIYRVVHGGHAGDAVRVG